MSFGKVSFYGKKGLKKTVNWKERLRQKELEFSEAPAIPQYRARLDSPSAQWRIFYRQKDAFEFARAQSQELHVFAFESETFQQAGGQRLYLVASLEHFWHYYGSMNRQQRHHYEVIPEGAVCHLYFDIEFQREFNPNKDGSAAVNILIKYICAQLQKILKVHCTERDILRLDASTSRKFSQHLVFHLDKAAFKCNVTAGHFVHEVMRQVLDEVHSHRPAAYRAPSEQKQTSYSTQEEGGVSGPDTDTKVSDDKLNEISDGKCLEEVSEKDDVIAHCGSQSSEVGLDHHGVDPTLLKSAGLTTEDLACLLVQDKGNKSTLLTDLGVYTRNRNFRLYLSCKLGKDNPLSIAPENCYSPQGIRGNQISKGGLRRKLSTQQQFFLDSLVTVAYTSGLRILTYENTGHVHRHGQPQGNSQAGNATDVLEGYDHSPFPQLDGYISSHAASWGDGSHGTVRRWTYFSHGALLIYDISHNRWCGRIQRCHKSNNIMLIVDLKKRVFYQKCHDPECKALNYKSPDHPLPPGILPAVTPCDEDEFFTDLPDDELVNAVNMAEAQTLDFSDDDDEELMKAAELMDS